MPCLDREAARAFAEGRLPSIEQTQASGHLASCASCRTLVEGLRALAASEPGTGNPTHTPVLGPPGPLPAPPPSEVSADLLVGTQVGRYVVMKKLGAGGMGAVYGAFDPELNRRVAIKLLYRDPGSSSSSGSGGAAWLLRESQALAQLAHPNVVTIHDVGAFAGSVFMAMEWVEGTTLSEWLSAAPRSAPQVLDAFVAAGRGLEAAHAKGLVHRDIKPDNILVGSDGRVRVTDFGLARSSASSSVGANAPEPRTASAGPGGPGAHDGAAEHAPATTGTDAPSGSDRLHTPLTRAGAVMGTPAYMAPEQYAGVPADERTDQFGFCVALYKALWKQHPFIDFSVTPRPTPEQFGLAVIQGAVRDPPKSPKVPLHVRRAVLKGLSRDQRARHASMTALLAELARRPVVTPTRIASALGLTGLATVSLALQLSSMRAREAVCTGSEQHLALVWTGALKERIEQAFLGTRLPYARSTFASVARTLDGFRRGWLAAFAENCLATQVRKEQSAIAMDLRGGCLLRKAQDVRAVTRLLEAPDQEVVLKSLSMVEQVSDLGECANVEALLRGETLPTEPAPRARIEAVRAMLAEALALQVAGKYAQALVVAVPAAEEAERLPFVTLRAEAGLRVGLLKSALSRPAEAEAALRSALRDAEKARHDRLRVHVLTALVRVTGFEQRRHAEADAWALAAGAAVERVGDDQLRAQFLRHRGSMLYVAGREREAVASHRESIELLGRIGEPDTAQLAMHYNALGMTLNLLGEYAEARQVLERSRSVLVSVYGPEHPRTTDPLHNLGELQIYTGRFEEAVASFREVLRVSALALGQDSVELAVTSLKLGEALGRTGRFDEAEAAVHRALELRRKAQQLRPTDESYALFVLGELAARQERWGEAERLHVRSIELALASVDAEGFEMASSYDALGRVFTGQRRYAKALEHHRRSLAIYEKTIDPQGLVLSEPLHGQAEALLGLQRAAEALPLLERVLKLIEKQTIAPAFVASTRLSLARALVAHRGSREEAAALAREAQAAVEGNPGERPLARRIAAFLAGL